MAGAAPTAFFAAGAFLALALLLWPSTVTVMVAMVRRRGLVPCLRVCAQPPRTRVHVKVMVVALLCLAGDCIVRASNDRFQSSSSRPRRVPDAFMLGRQKLSQNRFPAST